MGCPSCSSLCYVQSARVNENDTGNRTRACGSVWTINSADLNPKKLRCSQRDSAPASASPFFDRPSRGILICPLWITLGSIWLVPSRNPSYANPRGSRWCSSSEVFQNVCSNGLTGSPLAFRSPDIEESKLSWFTRVGCLAS